MALPLLTLRRCVFAAVFLVASYTLYITHKKYRSKILKCQSQSVPNQPCTLFPQHPRRDAFKALFQRWAALAERHNISYALTCGSLLGQYRNQDITPWDADIDIFVDMMYYDQLKQLGHPLNFSVAWDDKYRLIVQPEFHVYKRELEPRRWNCVGQEVKKLVDLCSFTGLMARFIGFHQRHVSLDMFPIETINGVVYDDEHSLSYTYSDIYPFVDCTFMGVRTKCPNNARDVLLKNYGSITPSCKCVAGKWTPDYSVQVIARYGAKERIFVKNTDSAPTRKRINRRMNNSPVD